jgi:hypothetical protein
VTRKLKLDKREDGYWITGYPGCDECGPYNTRAEADDDRCGLERTLEFGDEPDFWTREKTL